MFGAEGKILMAEEIVEVISREHLRSCVCGEGVYSSYPLPGAHAEVLAYNDAKNAGAEDDNILLGVKNLGRNLDDFPRCAACNEITQGVDAYTDNTRYPSPQFVANARLIARARYHRAPEFLCGRPYRWC